MPPTRQWPAKCRAPESVNKWLQQSTPAGGTEPGPLRTAAGSRGNQSRRAVRSGQGCERPATHRVEMAELGQDHAADGIAAGAHGLALLHLTCQRTARIEIKFAANSSTITE